MDIAVVGAGAWGTALAISAARHGRAVTLWARDAAHVAAMARDVYQLGQVLAPLTNFRKKMLLIRGLYNEEALKVNNCRQITILFWFIFGIALQPLHHISQRRQWDDGDWLIAIDSDSLWFIL